MIFEEKYLSCFILLHELRDVFNFNLVMNQRQNHLTFVENFKKLERKNDYGGKTSKY